MDKIDTTNIGDSQLLAVAEKVNAIIEQLALGAKAAAPTLPSAPMADAAAQPAA